MTLEQQNANIFGEFSSLDISGVDPVAEERADDLVLDLFEQLGHEDVGPAVRFGVEACGLSIEVAAEILNRAVWSGEENGSSLQKTLEHWLTSAESEIVCRLALHVDTFFFATANEMDRVLEEVAVKFPKLSEICKRLREQRRRQRV